MSYTSTMAACADVGAWEQAVALLRDMPAKGITPDEYC